MRVLWLSPIELTAVTHQLGRPAATRGGGWIDALRAAVSGDPGLALGIACITPTPFGTFEHQGVTYMSLSTRSGSTRWRRAAMRSLGRQRTIDYSGACLRAMEEFRPDVVHVHGTETTLGAVSCRTNLPVVVSMQGVVSDVARHYFDGVSATEILTDTLRIPSTLRGVGLLPSYIALRRSISNERRIISAVRFFTGRTEYDRRAVLSLNSGAVYFHADRILRSLFYSEVGCRESLSGVIYCTGGAAPYKGIELVLDAVSLLLPDHPGITVRIAGSLEHSAMGRLLRRRARRLAIENRVIWLGPLNDESIVHELATCSVYVHASHVDNSPNSLAEAMIRGVPCVASSAGGIPSMIEHGVDGLIFDAGRAVALAESIRVILGSPELAIELGSSARKKALRRHDARHIARSTLEMYQQVAALAATDN